MQLDRGVAKFEALRDHIQVLLGGRERHRGRVRRDRPAKAAQELPGRLARDPASQIPQRRVNQAEDEQRELLGTVQLPHPVPQPLPLERVRAGQFIAQDAIADVLQDRARAAPGRERDALRARLGADPQHPALTIRRCTPQPPPPGEGRLRTRDRDGVGLYMRDPHPANIHHTSVVSQEMTYI